MADSNRTWLPIAGAAVVAGTVLAVVLGVGGGSDRGAPTGSEGTAVAGDGALACPRTYRQSAGDTAGWVPRKPQGVNGTDRLVPGRTPTHVVVCAYLGGKTPQPGKARTMNLTGRSKLGGDLAAVTRTLTGAPRGDNSANTACPAYLSKTDGDNYVIGLSYGSATLWVSAPGYHCDGATNGRFVTSMNLRPVAAASYAARRWVPDPH